MKTFIDIGACVGEFTDDMLKKHKDCIVHAIEPFGTNYSYLFDKYAKNERVKLYKMAIGAFDGTTRLWLKEGSKGIHWAGNGGCSLYRAKSELPMKEYDVVPIQKISTFMRLQKINYVDIMKIDVEGAEYDIFDDILHERLWQLINKIYYENHTRKIPELLDRARRFQVMIEKIGIKHKFMIEKPEGFCPL